MKKTRAKISSYTEPKALAQDKDSTRVFIIRVGPGAWSLFPCVCDPPDFIKQDMAKQCSSTFQGDDRHVCIVF